MWKKSNYKNQSESSETVNKKELFVNSLKLPKDTMFGVPVLTITGNREIWMENYKGILEYTTTEILLQAKTCQICIEGKSLFIDYYTNEDMKISGIINNIRYL